MHDAVQFAGPGAEIAAILQSELFGELAAPVERVGARFVPNPAAAALEAQVYPVAGADRRGRAAHPARGRKRVADFIIRIPRVSVAVSEAELTDLLVDAGEHVEEGTPIYVIATEKVEQEIEAGASGTCSGPGQIGTHLRHRRRNRRHQLINER